MVTRFKKRARPVSRAAALLGAALVLAAVIVTAGQIYLARPHHPPRAPASATPSPIALPPSAPIEQPPSAAPLPPPPPAPPPTEPTQTQVPPALAPAPASAEPDASAEPTNDGDETTGDASTGGPRPPRGAVIAARGRLAALVDTCVGTSYPNRRVRINVVYDAATGAPTTVRVRGFFGLSPVAACITDAVRQAPLPPFGTGTWEAGHSFPTRGP